MLKWKKWKPGDPITINRVVWGAPEVDQVLKMLDGDWFAAGRYIKEFEKQFAALVEQPHCQTLNSGTSAIFLAVQILVEEGIWKSGDKIVHPYLTFPTSMNPLLLFDLRPVLIDVDPGTCNLSCDALEIALRDHPDIRGAVIPHLLGNSPDMALVLDMLGDRLLIEDCCDTIGSKAAGQQVGTFGEAAAYSFYASHNVTTAGVGGALVTNNQGFYRKVRSMVHWGRNESRLPDNATVFARFRNRYWYTHVGYDLQMTEVQAAFGLGQLTRLPDLTAMRRRAFALLGQEMAQYEGRFILPKVHPGNDPIWFGYPLTIPNQELYWGLVEHLIENKIEIRPLFTGNILAHPAYQPWKAEIIKGGPSHQADLVLQGGLFLPAWNDEQSPYVAETIHEFMRKQS